MKKLITVLLFLITSSVSYSQVIARLSNLKLTEDFGQIYKSPLGAELGYCVNYLEERVQFYATIGWFKSQAKAEEFFGYGVLSGNGTQVLPTRTTYQNLNLIPISIAASFNAFEKPFTPFASLAVVAYFGTFQLESEGGLVATSGQLSLQGIGVQPNLGILYTHKDIIQFRFSVGKLMSVPLDSAKVQYWQTGLSSIFYL